jgi:hypothetical protein
VAALAARDTQAVQRLIDWAQRGLMFRAVF